ncbi:MAG: 1-hydroxycarotenoid 3,4-desaturase CrtD [Flavobacteriales bacterium]
MKKAIIIGSGIAGLAASVRLTVKGYRVEVFEKNNYTGGKLTEIISNGFRFDAGPSLFTLPHQVDELFQLAGENPKEYFNYKRLPIVCNYFYEDGTRLHAYADPEKFADEVALKLNTDKKSVVRYLRKSKFIYDTTYPVFLKQSLHKLGNYLNFDFVKGVVRLPFLGIFDTIDGANKKWFSDERLVQLFNRYATYNGSDPYQAPAVLNAIPHLEFNLGAYFPNGGMHEISQSIYHLAKRKGVLFRLNQEVDEIIVKDKKAIAVSVGKEIHTADLIVCNSDIVPAYRKLLKTQKAPEKTLGQPRSSSALIFYWGIRGNFPELDMHNIFFSADYRAEFYEIFQNQTISDDPTVYINITSKLQKSDAPDGCENWFVMINVPGDTGQDWERLKQKAKEAILQKLSRLLGREISPLIITEEILEPKMIELKTSSFQGALYGSSSNNRYSAFLRHANFTNNIENLYFCGGSVHPGGGIPLCLLSAKIVSDLIH